MKLSLTIFFLLTLASCQTTMTRQNNPGGEAVSYGRSINIPSKARPNDATISAYEDRRKNFLSRRNAMDQLYIVEPKGNAVDFSYESNKKSLILEKELSEGFILSYLFYENGVIKYNGIAKDGRFRKNVDDETRFFSASTGKSITSYILGHAICEGYISSIDEIIDWPLMSKTLYQGQRLRDLLNMRAGDRHIVTKNSIYIKGSGSYKGNDFHMRDMDLETIAFLLKGTKKKGNGVFYNNFLADVIANYIAFKSGDNYDELMRSIFQDKVKIKHSVSYEKHPSSWGARKFKGDPQTLASYSYHMTRTDFLRVAVAMMKDYQNQTCVGKYLKKIQEQALSWDKYGPYKKNGRIYFSRSAKKYGGQFYFDFNGMSNRNIFGTNGLNNQNMLIDMDNSRIIVTNSAATGWDQFVFMFNPIRDGVLPK
ncbi:hypothetical protein N9Y58_00930 [Alphaproteobacteria bacterium]|nr:hypothetical protein [Alphaproteobacteria bacterium]